MRKAKPTTQEKQAANEVQKPLNNVVRSVRLAQAGLDDSEQLEFYKPSDWFLSEDHDFSSPFYIAKARLYTKGEWGNRVILTLAAEAIDGERSLVSLPENGQRLGYVEYFSSNTVAIGPCCFKRLDTGKGNPYYQICDASEAEGIAEDDEDVAF